MEKVAEPRLESKIINYILRLFMKNFLRDLQIWYYSIDKKSLILLLIVLFCVFGSGFAAYYFWVHNLDMWNNNLNF